MKKTSAEKPKCHIHDKVQDFEIDDIRKKVCVNDAKPIKHTDGKHYCLFHQPTKEKDVEKFQQIFQERLDTIKNRIAEIEELPEEEREAEKENLSYDFRFVWFPSEIDLMRYEFEVPTYFSKATFSASATFISATFSHDAYFDEATFSASPSFHSASFVSATFSASAYFSGATFSSDAYFISATFSSYVSFISATFSASASFRKTTFSASAPFISATFSASADFGEAIFSADVVFGAAVFSSSTYFSEAVFSSSTYFSEAVFSADVSFRSAKFLETSQVFFEKTDFCKNVDFIYTIFAGYIAFKGSRDKKVFLDKAILNLQDARLEKPEKISFHRVRLRPSWFVNVDPRKMVFTDVTWDNIEAKANNSNINKEIKSLEDREINEPKRLLEIACRQLAVNAEEDKRFEDASNLRYMAMETKRLEYRFNGWFWTMNWWYWISSGYGESWKRALLVLAGILVFFGLLYSSPFSTFDYGEQKQQTVVEKTDTVETSIFAIAENGERFRDMDLAEGIVHSVYVSALQRPEPKPANVWTKLFVILQTIFGPLQAALLALAIRRKFMR